MAQASRNSQNVNGEGVGGSGVGGTGAGDTSGRSSIASIMTGTNMRSASREAAHLSQWSLAGSEERGAVEIVPSARNPGTASGKRQRNVIRTNNEFEAMFGPDADAPSVLDGAGTQLGTLTGKFEYEVKVHHCSDDDTTRMTCLPFWGDSSSLCQYALANAWTNLTRTTRDHGHGRLELVGC